MKKNFPDQAFSLSNYKYFLLLFVFWPFIAFITALSNYNQKEARKIVYIFLIYYGLTFIIGDAGMDADRYAKALQLNSTLPFSDFFKIVGGLYSGTSVDILEPLISFIISRFTSDYSFLFAAYAAFFGFFYLKSINILYDGYKEKPGWNAMIFMVFFVIILPITAISAVRMWTAAWIFFYGACHIILFRKPKYFLITFGACLMHWSFILVNIVLVIYFFVGNRNFIYLSIVVASYAIPNALVPFFDWASINSGAALQFKYSGYASEDYIELVQGLSQQLNWFVPLSRDLIFYYLLIVIIIIYLVHRDIMREKAEKNLFSFLLLFLSFVNFGKPFPDFYRFRILFLLFATLFVFLYFLKLPERKINLLTIIGLFPMALYAAVEFRIGSEIINSWIFLPGFGIPLLVPGISLAEFIFH